MTVHIAEERDKLLKDVEGYELEVEVLGKKVRNLEKMNASSKQHLQTATQLLQDEYIVRQAWLGLYYDIRDLTEQYHHSLEFLHTQLHNI